jgi:hypothetical protein
MDQVCGAIMLNPNLFRRILLQNRRTGHDYSLLIMQADCTEISAPTPINL